MVERRVNSFKHIGHADEGQDEHTTSMARKVLMEWAPMCKALGISNEDITFQEGGIREEHFESRGEHLLLFHTFVHTSEVAKESGVRAVSAPLGLQAKKTGFPLLRDDRHWSVNYA